MNRAETPSNIDDDIVTDERYARLILASLNEMTSINPGGHDEDDESSMNNSMDRDPVEALILECSNESNWVKILVDMVAILPDDDPRSLVFLGQYLEFTPLPSLESCVKVHNKLLKLISSKRATGVTMKHALIAWAMLAEKLAGKISSTLCTDELLEVIKRALLKQDSPGEQLAALIALEKFSSTTENKNKMRTPELLDTLMLMEKQEDSAVPYKRQSKFYASWLLDHDRRKWTVDDLKDIKCCFDRYRSTEGWKVSPDGLELRSDAMAFQGFRATRSVTSGKWYYEVELLTAGVMQIGWANDKCHLDPSEGQGVGDDNNSVSYDGHRKRIWRAEPIEFGQLGWSPGDFLGVYLDWEKREFWTTLNGIDVNGKFKYDSNDLFNKERGGLSPAASFTAFQHCIFNFGAKPFRHPPPEGFHKMDSNLSLEDEVRLEKSKHLLLATTMNALTMEDGSLQDLTKCTICFAAKACVTLKPCKHEGFCSTCSMQVEICPICRAKITERITIPQ